MSKINIRPLGDRALIEPIKDDIKTKSGIVIPETMEKERPEKGRVIAVGDGRLEDGKRIAPAVKKSEIVLFSKYGPTEIKVEGKEYLIVKEDDILAIIED